MPACPGLVGSPRDLALPAALLGAPAIPLVLVDGAGVSAVVPGGALTITRDGADAGAATETWPGAPSARRIRLSPGTRVAVVLPVRCAGSAYRRAGDAVGGGAPITIEVTMVRARRAPSHLGQRVIRRILSFSVGQTPRPSQLLVVT